MPLEGRTASEGGPELEGGAAVGRTTVGILGCTGSIGTQTLDVLRANPDRFELIALGARSSTKLLLEQVHDVPMPLT